MQLQRVGNNPPNVLLQVLTHAVVGERYNWIFYDVGGARTQRPAWQSYFSHVDALIFLAPISAFDQALAEDSRVNRLEDSLLLFKSICKSELLKNVNIILFLNKVRDQARTPR
jgi:guanine nucleotide-binding protein subunit alpha